MQVGDTNRNHVEAPPSYIPDGDPGRHGGGTYTAHSVEPTLEAYENIFGPSARDIKQDLQRFKRHGRWHLPDILKGPNQYLTDRVDGLITDATSSPFTSRILPYKYITNVDGKIKWNVWSFDEGLASRVPYESAARTLQQSKRSYAGYFIRQGMAIVLEHNFMMTEAGRENFRRQLNQLVGSIQLTNDLDVHVALVLAPSYQKTMNEKYMTQDKSAAQICREFVEMFGFVQKNQNALDILIEEAKTQLRTWGSPMPDFMLCNSKLTFQLTMTPDRTNIVTQGAEGQKRLKSGPEMSSYRGIGIVHTRAFSMETGTPPRDILRRRVRVAEYYRILPHKDNYKRVFQLYNEERDTWSSFTFQDLLQKAQCDVGNTAHMTEGPGMDNSRIIRNVARTLGTVHAGAGAPALGHEDADMADAPRLGTHLGALLAMNEVHPGETGYITQFFQQLFTGVITETFCWQPKPISDKLVFVPGTIDMEAIAMFTMDISDPANRVLMPSFIKHGLDYRFDHNPPAGGLATNKLRYLINSVAAYPRDVNRFNHILNNGELYFNYELPNNYIFHDLQALVDIRDNGQGATPEDIALRNYMRSFHIRNFKRYGIPTALLQPNVRVGDSTKRIEDALQMSENPINPANHWCKQTLRDLGAWNCPNHFRQPTKQFRCFGDLIGYHMLMGESFVQGCMASRDARWSADSLYWSHTRLFDIILDNGQKYRALYDEVKRLLNTIKTNRGGGNMTRTEMAYSVQPDIQQCITQNYGRAFTHHSRYENESYWWLPRVSTTDEDVLCTDSHATNWKRQLSAYDGYQHALAFTPHVIGEIATATVAIDTLAPESINYAVPIPADLPDITDKDVTCFFNMLAWRLWADQEIDLDYVYNSTHCEWPPFDHYIHPGLRGAPANFGQGLMLYNVPQEGPSTGLSMRDANAMQESENIEIVIVRPNIEHHMMGIILGQGGESLGSTFWGQTELSCYDDSMHGIWGMSYKYHERAIVINERNLIRLWDVAYDGYVGGKDDTAVDWNADETSPYSRHAFMQATTDVTRPYRGPSMMVMAFHHKSAKNRPSEVGGESVYKRNFNSNWPSPVVFYDRLQPGNEGVAVRADFDNLHVVDAQQFRVFNNPLYYNAYAPYKDKMPDFWELHTIRKNAGLAAMENEVSSDALAFQGTMRVVSAETGGVIQEVLGSGHHGPDFIGVASLRAGKGYRLNSQPTQHRLV